MERVRAFEVPVQRRLALGRAGFAVLAVSIEILAILASALATGVGYHLAVYGDTGPIESYAAVGALMGTGYTLPFLYRSEYKFQNFIEQRRSAARLATAWGCAILGLALIGFLTKTTAVFSRGAVIMFFVAGFAAACAADAMIAALLRSAVRGSRIAHRRLMLVGEDADLDRVAADIDASGTGLKVVAVASLPAGGEKISSGHQAIEAAVARAREVRIEDVVILMDWSRGAEIEELVGAFSKLPLSVHLGISGVVSRYTDARIERIGSLPALALTLPPLGIGETFAKRAFDILVASIALVLLAPLFAVIAVLVKRDSRGPVFFRQRRRGYNLEEFRIWKFRTMTTMDDGDVVRQASVGDARVTRIGRILRRFNFDELPQLINVLAGEMSIVGPRPHAVAHDRMFETRIDAYPRRLNVRPGITGWAQVNGLRGATDEEQMRRRVAHDIYYIDNWSLGFDLYILALTVLSPKAYRNAY